MSRSLDLVAALTQVSRRLRTPDDLVPTLQTLVTVARDASPGVDHVGVVVRSVDRRLELVAATDEVVREVVDLHVELGEGPFLHVLDEEPALKVDRLAEEARWPAYVARATSAGISAQIGVRFPVDDRTVGTLTMLSSTSDTLTEDDARLADLVAAHAGLTMSHARDLEHLGLALQSRTVIGVALGLVMQRLDLDQKTAFSYLGRISATSETKLRDVAAALVEQHHEGLLTRRGDEAAGDPA